MRDKINPDSIGFLMSDIARHTRATFAREIEKSELPVTAAEARVIAHMVRCGAARQHILAESLGMTPMSLTGFLDKLEKAGLIIREPDPDDRRAKIASLTPQVADIIAEIAHAGVHIEAAVSKNLTADEWKTFQRLAYKVRDGLSEGRVSKLMGTK